MTTPVGDLQVVSAKFAAAVLLYDDHVAAVPGCCFIIQIMRGRRGVNPGHPGGHVYWHWAVRCVLYRLRGFCFFAYIEPDGGRDDQRL